MNKPTVLFGMQKDGVLPLFKFFYPTIAGSIKNKTNVGQALTEGIRYATTNNKGFRAAINDTLNNATLFQFLRRLPKNISTIPTKADNAPTVIGKGIGAIAGIEDIMKLQQPTTRREFLTGVGTAATKIVGGHIADTLPARIANGITKNINSATGANAPIATEAGEMGFKQLANSVVTNTDMTRRDFLKKMLYGAMHPGAKPLAENIGGVGKKVIQSISL